ncbi:cytochrome P450 2C15-like [Tigriopus californicus]|uniref:cytochrome P450 2C15-like n=1 Tax=Tigriopus californicus TaxID=6832 RepID=UPI0027DA7992|nr:cytochrome P450 2C15-like [Tigriopus californicus]
MIGSIIVALFVWSVFWWFKHYSHPKNFPPSPRVPWPLLGDILLLGENIVSGFHAMKCKYGDIFGLFLGPQRIVVICDFETLQEVMNRPEFTDRPLLFESQRPFRLDDGQIPGIAFSNGMNWVEQRRFTLHSLRDHGFGKTPMEEIIDGQVERLCQDLEKDNQMYQDVSTKFNIAIISALWKITTGQELAFDDEKAKSINGCLSNIDLVNGSPIGTLAFTMPILGIILDKLKFFDFEGAFSNIARLTKPIVKEHRDTFQPDHIRDFIDSYIEAQNDPSKGFSFSGNTGDMNLFGILEDFYAAGSSTISLTLTWCMLFLSNYPEMQEKIQQEVERVTTGNRLIEFSERSQTPFTEAFIHETQRCADIAPLALFRICMKDTHIKSYFIPKGTILISNLNAVMRNSKEFPDPWKFNPNRFIDDDGKFKPSLHVVPFGIGRRRCLGESLAKMELYKYVTGITHRFVIRRKTEDLNQESRMPKALTKPMTFHVKFVPRL